MELTRAWLSGWDGFDDAWAVTTQEYAENLICKPTNVHNWARVVQVFSDAGLAALAFLALRSALGYLVREHALWTFDELAGGHALACKGMSEEEYQRKKNEHADKYAHEIYMVVGHSITTLSAWNCYREPFFWFTNVGDTSLAFTSPITNVQPMTDPVYWCFVCNIGYELNRVIAWCLFDTKRKDSWVMLVHHFATTYLMYLCIYDAAIYCGPVILSLLECTDIPLHLAKWARKEPWCIKVKLDKAFFATLVLCWFPLRIYFYPLILLEGLISSINAWKGVYMVQCKLYPILWFLVLLNIFWSWFILEILLRVFFKGEDLQDYREDKKDFTIKPSHQE